MEDSMNEIKRDNYPEPATIESTKNILHQMENNICKIQKTDGGKGTGFFVKISYNNSIIPVLMTSYHVLDEQYLEDNKEIAITLKDGKPRLIIQLSEKRRIYCNKEYDTTIIEIKPQKDKINDFMELDDDILEENSNKFYNRKSIYIIHYPNSEKIKVSYGIIRTIEDFNISHFSCTEEGSSGSPIINLLNNKVIGMHNRGCVTNQTNFGTYLKDPTIGFINKFIQNNKIINDAIVNNNNQSERISNQPTNISLNINAKNKNCESNKIYKENNYLIKDNDNDIGNKVSKIKNFII